MAAKPLRRWRLLPLTGRVRWRRQRGGSPRPAHCDSEVIRLHALGAPFSRTAETKAETRAGGVGPLCLAAGPGRVPAPAAQKPAIFQERRGAGYKWRSAETPGPAQAAQGPQALPGGPEGPDPRAGRPGCAPRRAAGAPILQKRDTHFKRAAPGPARLPPAIAQGRVKDNANLSPTTGRHFSPCYSRGRLRGRGGGFATAGVHEHLLHAVNRVDDHNLERSLAPLTKL